MAHKRTNIEIIRIGEGDDEVLGWHCFVCHTEASGFDSIDEASADAGDHEQEFHTT